MNDYKKEHKHLISLTLIFLYIFTINKHTSTYLTLLL